MTLSIAERAELARLLELKNARSNFLDFVTFTKPDYQVNWHHKLFADTLNRFLFTNEIPRLMIFAPPRHGKSELISRRFPAFALGCFPDTKIISTSYGADLASQLNRDVQRIIDDPSYAKIFPDTKLSGANVRTTGNWLRNSETFEVVGRRGVFKSAGVGGPITGSGADCFVADTLIRCYEGDRPIQSIRPGDLVLSFNHLTQQNEYKKVLATREKSANKTIIIETLCHKKIECTPDHRIFANGKYTPAVFCRPGSMLFTENEMTLIFSLNSQNKEKNVYDIQVEGNHNFFANGILAHNCLIIDDPIKNQEEAGSPTYRQKVWDWYTTTAYTRLENDLNSGRVGKVCLTVTRWHEGDLAGKLLSEAKRDPKADQWHVLSLPAIAEGTLDPADPRNPGEALWPNKYNIEKLQSMRATVGPQVFNALFQQRPASPEGGIFKRDDWQRYDYAERDTLRRQMDVIFASWDLAFKKATDSDFVAGHIWGRKGGAFYLLDRSTERRSFTESVKAVSNLAAKWPEARGKLVEAKANGEALVDVLKKDIPGLILVEPKGGKTARAQAVAPFVEAGSVFIPNTKWGDDFIENAAGFPNVDHDDDIDAMSQALLKMGDDPTDRLKRLLGGL
jgi:predicted phage terminase large subunit-like protein